MKMTYKKRLDALRAALPDNNTCFVIPRTDAYQGEYIRACDERLAWLTGFTGSAGTCLVLPDKAILFTDGRYTLQAAQQIDTNIFQILDSTHHKVTDYIGDRYLAFDPWLLTLKQQDTYTSQGITLIPVVNPIDKLWHDRPTPVTASAYLHSVAYTGEATPDKVQRVLSKIPEGIDALLMTSPESVNWLLNIRGDEVDHTPVVLCYGILYRDGRIEVVLESATLPKEITAFASQITLEALSEKLADKRVTTDFSTTPVQLKISNAFFVNSSDPCTYLKAIKNNIEIEGARDAHVYDGTAVCTTFAHAKDFVDELDIIEKLEKNRAKHDTFKDSSFDTIAGVGANGAIIHYRATEETNKPVMPTSMILIDSGGQYLEGTTDITRTIVTGQPTPEQCTHYTLVLKGLVSLSTLQWPKGKAGRDIDVQARAALWSHGLDYAHGTGHGVGSFLSVHEGPQGISHRNTVALEQGMILSIEPGYYLEGAYGIRLENLVVVQPSARYQGFLCFETLTLCPFERKLIQKSMLTLDELDWLNAYHKSVFDKLNSHMSMMDSVWLSEACATL